MEFENIPPSPCPHCGADMAVFTSPLIEGYTEAPVSHWRCGCGLTLPVINGHPAPAQFDSQGHVHLSPGATRCRCQNGAPGFDFRDRGDGRPGWECAACAFPLSLAVLLAAGDAQRAQGLKGDPFDPWSEGRAADPAAAAKRAEREKAEAASEHVCPACKKRKLIRRPTKKDPSKFWWGCAGFPSCDASFFDDAGSPGKRMTKK